MIYSKKSRTWLGVVATAITVLVLASPAMAQRKQARVWGVISDQDGVPLAEVAITAESPDTGEVVAETVSDAEGAYSLLINDATVSYLYRLSKEGYVPLAQQLSVAVKANDEYNMTLPSLASVKGGAMADGSYAMHPDAVKPYDRAFEAARQGDYDSASAAFEEVLSLDDSVVPALVALSAIRLEQGSYAQSSELATRAVELDPSNVKGIELRYMAFKHNGASVEELMPMLVELEEVSPIKAAAGHAEVGLSHFNAGDMDAAQSSLNHALALNPDLPAAHFQLGLCYVNARDSDQARHHFERVVELAPGTEDAATAAEMMTYLE